jgi:CBS domain-containing protein
VSGTTTRVFIARLSGVAVFDPNGDQVGRVRDFVVSLLTGSRPPRVLGVIVEVPPRRRIFLPIGRVRSFAASQVIVSGLVNLRRFEKRPSETLVLGELLDRAVTIRADGSRATIVDVAIEQSRTRDWDVTKLYVKKGGGFRRKGQSSVVGWDDVSGLHDTSDGTPQGADALLANIESLRPQDIADMLREVALARRIEIAGSLDDGRLAQVLGELGEDDAAEIISQLDVERAADVLEDMDPDDATDLVRQLPPAQRSTLLQRMEDDEAEDIMLLLRYPEDSAGGLMTTEPVIVGPDATVAEALARIRSVELPPSLAAQVYCVRPPLESPTGKYLGVAHFQALLREPPASLVSALVDSDLEPIGPRTPIGEVARYFATYNLVAVPVVDDSDHLLGAVTVDDLVDHMLPEDWRDEPHEGVSDGRP